jgi:hypothetical protein
VTDEIRTLLIRAAEQEARRLAAKERGDTDAELRALLELRELWKRYGELERIVA